MAIDPEFLKKLIIVLVLVIGAYTVIHKDLGLQDHFTGLSKKKIIMAMCLALGLGFYDGFFGPGTGAFLIFGLISIFGFDFVKASANTRLLNLASNITALTLSFLMVKFISLLLYQWGSV